jgi:alpha-glucosidase
MKQQKEALFHDGSSQFCKYNEKSDTYTFILRTTIGAVNQAFMEMEQTSQKELILQEKRQ